MHIDDKYLVTVYDSTDSNDDADVEGPKINVTAGGGYDFIRAGLPASAFAGENRSGDINDGVNIYWLRLDNPVTKDTDEGSDLELGFSSMLFDGRYWFHGNAANERIGPPLQYEFEALRTPGIKPAQFPHMFAFNPLWGKRKNVDEQFVEWDSTEADTNEMQMEARQYVPLEWVFTQPGTYAVSVHIKGHMRQSQPTGWDDTKDGTWKRLTTDTTVTSQVKQYTIRVGDLKLNDQPRFVIADTLPERSPAGTNVGSPIRVADADGDRLYYTLSGEDKKQFEVTNTPQGAQVQVSGTGYLDYETKKTYDLTLKVSDRKNREGDADRAADDKIDAQVNLSDVRHSINTVVSVVGHPDRSQPKVNEGVHIVVTIPDEPPGAKLGTGRAPTSRVLKVALPVDVLLKQDPDDRRRWVTTKPLSFATPGTRDYTIGYDYHTVNEGPLPVEQLDFSITWTQQ